MTDQLDDQIRDLLAVERERAPLPRPWHDVVAVSDRRRARLYRGLALVTAAVVVLGVLALVVLAPLRDTDGERADLPPDTGPATPTIPTPAAPSGDPLAGLTAGDWVVPDPVPPGFERVAAAVTEEDTGRTIQVFVATDDQTEVYLTTATGDRTPDDDDVEVIIGAVTWFERTMGPIDGAGDWVQLWQASDDVVVSLETVGRRDDLLAFAAALHVVPDDELGFEYLDPDGPYTRVASVAGDDGSVSLMVRGLDGSFCVRVEHEGGVTGSGCISFTTPGAPFLPVLSSSGPGSYSAGLVEPGVTTIDITTPGGDVLTVTPVDESGQYEQLFWLAPGFPPGLGDDLLAVTLHLDDGSSVDLVKSPLGRWLAPGSVAPEAPAASATPSDPLADLGDGDWAVPSVLPDGVRRSWADVSPDGTSRTQSFFVDNGRPAGDATDDAHWDDLRSAYVTTGSPTADPLVGEPVEIDGITWVRVATDGGASEWYEIERVAGSGRVTVSGRDDDAELLRELAASLVVAPADQLDFGIVDPNGTYLEVTSAEVGSSRFALEVIGGQGRYCTRLTESGTIVSGACNGIVTDSAPFFNALVEFRADATVVAGYAMPDVASFVIIARDGSSIEAETTGADGFDDRFWLLALPTSVDLRSPTVTIEITRDDGSTDVLAKGEFGRWLIVSSDG